MDAIISDRKASFRLTETAFETLPTLTGGVMIQRYVIDGYGAFMVGDDNGEWIMYEDYAAERSAMCEANSNAVLGDVTVLLQEAVTIDGAHHKQWYLEEIAEKIGIKLPDHDKGIAP